MSTMRPPLTTSMTGPLTTPSASLICSMEPHARSYWARFFESTRRPSLSSFWRTNASTTSPSETISEGAASLRIDSSREGITPSDLKPMSSRTSSLSTLTTVPETMSPSSNSTIVPEMASSKDWPPRSSAMTWRGMYSPASSKVPNRSASEPSCRKLSGVVIGSVMVVSDMKEVAFVFRTGVLSVAVDKVGAITLAVMRPTVYSPASPQPEGTRASRSPGDPAGRRRASPTRCRAPSDPLATPEGAAHGG